MVKVEELMAMIRRPCMRWSGAAVLILVLGCDPAAPAATDGPVGSSSDAQSTGGSDGGGGMSGSTGTTDGVEPNPQPTTGTAEEFQCNQWTQNCPEGEKCALYSQGGDDNNDFDAAKCVPVVDPPKQLDELCISEGEFGDGLDDCDAGLICVGIGPTKNGTCVPLCQGLEDDPLCPEDWLCAGGSGNFFDLCLPSCDPLAQDCIEGTGCYGTEYGFVCMPDKSGDEGQLFDPCQFSNSCEPGLYCGPTFASPECMQSDVLGCCTPICELGGSCPAGTDCAAVWDPPHPDYPDVGVCVAPS